ncbi:hypothetical protein GIB67_020752 [Kingdonia uniflora]|uniref:Uncharacterized protein n=1 Tax=Kingdonia uniflora TaxID=39325 RepID=A0A7J7M710_9MAGN|nr:hypothetical protein GIB67_020752 [Kingdonia uniflora]
MAKKMINYDEVKSGQKLREIFFDFIKDLISFPLNIPGTIHYKCLQGRKKAMKLLKDMLAKRRDKALPEKVHGDFMDLIMKELKKEEMILTEGFALDLMFVLLFANIETTSSALTLAFKILADYPLVVEEQAVPPQLYDSFIATIDKGSMKSMQNRSMPADPYPTPEALLMGDAFNMRHPLTDRGMTVALYDIAVGAQTETELKEKKLRVEDVLNATKAAVAEGIVVGGGCTLLRLAAKVDAIKLTLDNVEQKVGADIVKRALSYPLKLIAKNAGDNGSVVTEKVLSSDNFKYGYNAATGKYEDLMVVGIIDPTKVCWVFQKIGSHDDKGLQRYLYNVHYKCVGILRYERVFGHGFVSTVLSLIQVE